MCDFVNPGVLGTRHPCCFLLTSAILPVIPPTAYMYVYTCAHTIISTHNRTLSFLSGSYASFKRVFETPILLAREPGATVEEKALGDARSKEVRCGCSRSCDAS